MIKQLLSLFFLLISMTIFSQVSYEGIVIDENKQPIQFVNVVAYEISNSTIIKEGVTNEQGVFKLKVKDDIDIYIEVSFFGYKTKKIIVESNKIGEIVLEEDGVLLDELIIGYKKQTLVRKNDRLVFNIENTIAQDLGSAIEVLKVTPNIIVKDDELSMMGKSFVRIMVNGKMLPLRGDELRGYLSGLNSSSIEKVEVISVPSAEFEAEGNGGIINIILKKEKNDFWSVVGSLSSTQRTLFSYGRNLAINYRKKNTYVTMNLSNGLFLKRNIFRNNNYYPEEIWKGNGPSEYQDNYLNYRLSVTQNITKNWEVGIGYSGVNSDIVDRINNEDKVYNLDNDLKYSLLSEGTSDKNAETQALNFNNTILLDSLGKNISLDIDYYKSFSLKEGRNNGKKQDLNIIQQTFLNNSSVDYNFENVSGQLDVNLPFDIIEFQLGGKMSFSKTNNDFKFYDSFSGVSILDELQSNVFNYDENIYAFYFSAAKKISENFSLKAGLRAENTITESFSKSNDQLYTKNYTKIFPSLFINYNLEGEKSLSFSINRRLERPTFESLDPFKIVLNPYKTVQGNPFLQPSYITNIELIFNYKTNELKFYSKKITDLYEQIIEINPESKITNYTYFNHLNIENFGLTNTFIFDKLNWLTSYATIDVGYSRMSSSISQTIGKQEGFNAFLQSQNYVKLNAKNTFSLGVNYYYVFAAKENVSKHGGYGPLDLSLRLNLLNNDLNLIMYANDIFKTSTTTVTGYYNSIKTTYNNYYDSRSLSLIVRYTFGNKKIGIKEDRSSNKDIKNRAQ